MKHCAQRRRNDGTELMRTHDEQRRLSVQCFGRRARHFDRTLTGCVRRRSVRAHSRHRRCVLLVVHVPRNTAISSRDRHSSLDYHGLGHTLQTPQSISRLTVDHSPAQVMHRPEQSTHPGHRGSLRAARIDALERIVVVAQCARTAVSTHTRHRTRIDLRCRQQIAQSLCRQQPIDTGTLRLEQNGATRQKTRHW
jgi:hypothetical protein